MPASTTRNLFLQVGADITPLEAASKAGKTALLNLSDAANDVASEVEKAFQGLNNGKIEATAKQIDRSFESTFANIRRNAASVMEAPTGKAALQILDVVGVEKAAAAADTQAAALRRTADAAALVAQRAGSAGDAERVLAVSTEIAAQQAEKQSIAMRAQANVVAAVAVEVRAASLGEAQANDEVSHSHTRMGASGMITEHVVRSLSDSIAAGQSPIRAATMEMGRISEALTLWGATTGNTEGKLGKLAGFMAGPWGIAASVGVAVLTPLVAQLFEGNHALDDAVKKLHDDAEAIAVADAAHRAFSKTIEGEIANQRKLNEELSKQVATQRQGQIFTLYGARKQQEQDERGLPKAEKDVADQQRRVASLRQQNDNPGADPDAAPAVAAALSTAEEKLIKLQGTLADVRTTISNGAVAIRQAEVPLIGSDVASAMDGKTLATDRYQQALGRLNRQLAIGPGRTGVTHERQPDNTFKDVQLQGIDEGQYRRQLAQLAAEKKEAEDAAAAAKKAADDTRQVGRTIDFSQAKDIVEGIGGRVTSSPTRSLAEQQRLYDRYTAYKDGSGPWAPLAAKPGTSMHGTGQAVDVAKSAGISLGALKKAFEDAGVHLTEALDEGDHFHVGYGKKGPSAETTAKREQSAADKRTRDGEAYTQLLDRAREDQLKLTRGQTTSIAEAASLDMKDVEIERSRLASAADAGATERKWTQAQADALKAIYQRNADLHDEDIRQKEGMALLDQQLNADRDQLSRSNVTLQLQSDLEDTVSARKVIALQLLANQEQEQRDAAIRLIGSEKPEDQAKGEADLKDIDKNHPLRVAQINRQFQNPMDTYRQQLTGDVGDMGRALDGVKADSLKGVEDGLVGILSGTKSVAQGFRDMADKIIADLARIAVEKLILSVIGLKDGGPVGGSILHLAGGGAVFGPGGPREDRIPAMLSAGEYVVNAAAYARHPELVQAINHDRLPHFADGGMVGGSAIYMRSMPSMEALSRPAPPPQIIHVITDKSALFDSHVTRIAAPLAQAAMVGGAAQASQDFADQRMAQIP